ncbi:hypothetical protein [Pseudomonas syringae]|uniref:hypothetical protein n=1 Tax=Pseudomonas syringae TaxID=317 RepID=UPI00101251E8|nr:hypothetical protein [Pseudomonas syringae]RXT60410.1 hypothetical protein B1F74_24865 [Pseudomonas syringae]
MIGEYLDPSLFMSSFMIAPLVRSSASSTISQVRKHFCYPTFKSYAQASELIGAMEEINSYRELEDDWDGYGAVAIDAVTLQNAIYAAARLIGRAPVPDLTPNSNGTISFEWESPFGLAHLEIGKSRYAFFIRLENGRKYILDGAANDVPHYLADSISSTMFSSPQPIPTMSGSRMRGFSSLGVAA